MKLDKYREAIIRLRDQQPFGTAERVALDRMLENATWPLLHELNNDAKGEIALAVSIDHDGKLHVDFGKEIKWIAMDAAHADIFIALLTAKRKEMP